MKEEKSVVEPELTEIATPVESPENTENPECSESPENPEITDVEELLKTPEPFGLMKGIPISDDTTIIRFRQSVWDFV